MNKTFSIPSAINFGWTTFKSNWKYWLIAYFIAFGMTSSSLNLGDLGKNSSNNRVSSETPMLQKSYTGNNVLGVNDSMYTAPTSNVNQVVQNSYMEESATEYTALWDRVKPWLIVAIPYGLIAFVGIIFLSIVYAATTTIVRFGYMHLLLDVARGNEFKFGTLLSDINIRKALNFWLLIFLYGFMVVIGFIFFIIPGIYLAIKYTFAPLIFIDKNTGVWEAFKLSAQMTKGSKIKLIGLQIINVAIFLVGILAFLVGVVPAAIVTTLATAHVYVQLDKQTAQPQAA